MLSQRDAKIRHLLLSAGGSIEGMQRCPCGYYVFPINCAVRIQEPEPLPSRVTMTIECPVCERQAEVDVPAMRIAGTG